MRRSKVDMVELQFISSKGRKNNERDTVSYTHLTLPTKLEV